jgi:hypothetical protein
LEIAFAARKFFTNGSVDTDSADSGFSYFADITTVILSGVCRGFTFSQSASVSTAVGRRKSASVRN